MKRIRLNIDSLVDSLLPLWNPLHDNLKPKPTDLNDKGLKRKHSYDSKHDKD